MARKGQILRGQELKVGMIVKTHLSQFTAKKNGRKGALEVEVLDIKSNYFVAKHGRMEKPLYIPFGCIVEFCAKKTEDNLQSKFEQSLTALKDKFTAGN